MSGSQEEAAAPDAAPARGSQRILLAVGLGLLAAILAIAARGEQDATSVSTDRFDRRIELSELIVEEQDRTQQLEAQLDQIAAEIAAYEATAVGGSVELAELQARVDEMAVPAGLTEVRGNGLAVTLTDSSANFETERIDPNLLVIHESDLRAVVNALFAGGAEAISINDSRVLSTTGIRCVGNTLYLNGRLYAPPFVIRAIGDMPRLQAALDTDPVVERFRLAAAEFGLGYEVSLVSGLSVPSHPGPAGLEVAIPAEEGA